MSDWMKNWGNFLTENKQPIVEVKPEELKDIEQMLDKEPEELSFNNLFGDKFRLIIPLDESSVISDKLTKFLNDAGYEVDLKKGIATGWAMRSKQGRVTVKLRLDQQDNYVNPDGTINVENLASKKSPEEIEAMSKRLVKRQIKIGKLLRKGIQLLEKEVEAPDDEAELDIQNRFRAFFALRTDQQDLETFKIYAKAWEKQGAAEAGHSVIISRHPIDVFRMSDFERIQSCHSPASRGTSGRPGVYYRCAPAEAHGHGLVTFVVRNKALDKIMAKREEDLGTKLYEPKDYQALLDDFQENDEEFFYDDKRNVGVYDPNIRGRIRKYSVPGAEIAALGVPETEVYGDNTAYARALTPTVTKWAKENQRDIIDKINSNPDLFDEDYGTKNQGLQLVKFVMHGGTYQDTPDSALFNNFMGHKTIGSAKIDRSTEESLELSSGGFAALTQRAENVQNNFNYSNYRRLEVQIDVEMGDYGPFIDARMYYLVPFKGTELKKRPFGDNRDLYIEALEDLPEVLDRTEDFFNRQRDATFQLSQMSGIPSVIIKIPLRVQTQQFGMWGDLEEFEDVLDRMAIGLNRGKESDNVKEIVKNHLALYGITKGTPIEEFAAAARSRDASVATYWEHKLDDEDKPKFVDITTAGVYVNFEDISNQIPIKYSAGTAPGSYAEFAYVGPPIELGLATPTFTGKESEPIATSFKVKDENGNLKGYELVSELLFGEYGTGKEGGFKDVDEMVERIQYIMTQLILQHPGRHNPDVSRQFHLNVRMEMKDAAMALVNTGADGRPLRGENYQYPNSQMKAAGPYSTDEYKMIYSMQLGNNSSKGQFEAVKIIMLKLDDEERLREVFRKAFAKTVGAGSARAAKAMKETKRYFDKFDLY